MKQNFRGRKMCVKHKLKEQTKGKGRKNKHFKQICENSDECDDDDGDEDWELILNRVHLWKRAATSASGESNWNKYFVYKKKSKSVKESEFY